MESGPGAPGERSRLGGPLWAKRHLLHFEISAEFPPISLIACHVHNVAVPIYQVNYYLFPPFFFSLNRLGFKIILGNDIPGIVS